MRRLKARLVEHLFQVFQSPRVIEALQDRRVIAVVVGGMSLPGRARAEAKRRASAVAHGLGLATVEDLRATEAEIARRLRSRG